MSTAPDRLATERTFIRPGDRRRLPDFAEIVRYQHLLRALIVRDLKVRYKQTALGVVWVVVQPFVAMVVFTVVLHRAVGVPSEEGIPYPIFTYSGLIFWQYFSESVQRSSRSLVANQVLITKVYFPRMIPPLAGVVSPVIDLLVSFAVLVGMLFWYGITPTLFVFTLPLLMVAVLVCGTAVGVGLAAVNVEYRDIGHAVPVVLQLWMFLTPVFYATSAIGDSLQVLEWVNPIANILPAIRAGLIGADGPDAARFAVSMTLTLVLLVVALMYFERVQRSFADDI